MKTVKYEPIPDHGAHMAMEKFIDACRNGMLIDLDGFAEYATCNMVTNIVVHPSEVIRPGFKSTYTHVVWFNK